MIKTFKEFVNEAEELEGFYDDLKTSEVKLKLFTNFKSEVKKEEGVTGDFLMGNPKKKFKPKTSILKSKKDKGIF